MTIDTDDQQPSPLPSATPAIITDANGVQTYSVADVSPQTIQPVANENASSLSSPTLAQQDNAPPAADAGNGGTATGTTGDNLSAPFVAQDTEAQTPGVVQNLQPSSTDASSSPQATSAPPEVAQARPDETVDVAASSDADSGTTQPKIGYQFVGLDGTPISNISYRVQFGSTVLDGISDNSGFSAPDATHSAGADCSVFVKTDTGDYKQVACFQIPGVDSTITLMSSSMLLNTTTQQHGGSNDTAGDEPQTPAASTPTGDGPAHPAYAADADDTSTVPNGTGTTSQKSTTASSVKPAQPVSTDQPQAQPPTGAASTSTASSTSKISSASNKPQSTQLTPAAKQATPAKGGSGKTPPVKNIVTTRDSLGHPQAQPVESWSDWANHKVNSAWHFIENWLGVETNPVVGKSGTSTGQRPSPEVENKAKPGQADLEAVAKKICKIAEEQTAHAMPSSATVMNLKQISDGTIKYSDKNSIDSHGQCYMYVKIALWKSNAVKFLKEKNGTFDSAGGNYAKVAGEFLESQGFVNVTAELPDARWAWPGDVIVYHVAGDKESGDNKGQPGHIDIRTYHFYISDFERNYLCMRGYDKIKKTYHVYEPIGIYRKSGFSDPLPIARMKAFLKIIRSREAKTFFELGGDSKTYYASQGIYNLKDALTDLSTWPSNGKTHQGAYQMTKTIWTEGQKPEIGALPANFIPLTQDRYAVYLLEKHPARFATPRGSTSPLTALGYIRAGEVEQAVELLRHEWASMPGTSQDQGYTMAQLKSDFEKYVKEYSN